MPEPPQRYWDSSVFLAWIKGEQGRADTCEAIIGDAREGRCVICTSTLTLVEVTKARRGPLQVDRGIEDQIVTFFRNEYIELVPLDYVIATRSRRLIWDFPFLGPRDAAHLATGLHLACDPIESYDDDFRRVATQIGGSGFGGFPQIGEPRWTGQPPLFRPGHPPPA